MLFVLVGGAVDLRTISGGDLLTGVLTIAASTIVRCVAAVLCLTHTPLEQWERYFVGLAWAPKATVQAAVGAHALDAAVALGMSSTEQDRGQMILTLAVLCIVLTAPAGTAAIAWVGPRWLRRR